MFYHSLLTHGTTLPFATWSFFLIFLHFALPGFKTMSHKKCFIALMPELITLVVTHRQIRASIWQAISFNLLLHVNFHDLDTIRFVRSSWNTSTSPEAIFLPALSYRFSSILYKHINRPTGLPPICYCIVHLLVWWYTFALITWSRSFGASYLFTVAYMHSLFTTTMHSPLFALQHCHQRLSSPKMFRLPTSSPLLRISPELQPSSCATCLFIRLCWINCSSHLRPLILIAKYIQHEPTIM